MGQNSQVRAVASATCAPHAPPATQKRTMAALAFASLWLRAVGSNAGSTLHATTHPGQVKRRGKGVFDVAYLLGTGMSEESRRQHELPILQHYYSELDANGANLMNYSFSELVRDYRICLWLTAAWYAIPEIYDRGTLSEENESAAEQVRAQLRHNLQPILDDDVVYQKM